MSLPMTREEAWTLFCEWTESESLRRHVLAVEACMRAYAAKFGADEERWGLVGMLHDLDYERYPDLHTGHPRYALAELERLEFPEDMIRAVASHADFLEVSRDTPMERTLYAVDELSGVVMACAYVRPQGIEGLTPKSIKKKKKTPASRTISAASTRGCGLRFGSRRSDATRTTSAKQCRRCQRDGPRDERWRVRHSLGRAVGPPSALPRLSESRPRTPARPPRPRIG